MAIKTVGLNCLMAQCGLHVTCKRARLCLNNQILCDIGDGQNIEENLSTFSAHITNVLDILARSGPESLVIMDELAPAQTLRRAWESRWPFWKNCANVAAFSWLPPIIRR